MARAMTDIEREIRELSPEDKIELIRILIADLDAPADENVERAWLETSQRRYRELIEVGLKACRALSSSTDFVNASANEVRVPSSGRAGAA